MGLDAVVMCNCFREGRTSEPPVPREWLYIDEEGYFNLRPEHDSNDNRRNVYEWKQSACEHPGMKYAAERISNWGGYRAFQQALGRVGWDHFPTLHAELPNSNGGLTGPAAAARALDELAHLRSLEALERSTYLVDVAAGEAIYEHIAAYDGVFIWAGNVGLQVGVGEFEFFVRDAKTKAGLFRSAHFRQRPLQPERVGRHWDIGEVELEDLDSGVRYRCPVAVRGREVPWADGRMQDGEGRRNYAVPSELQVESWVVTPQDFDSIITALEKVFRAAVATGNPVRWC